MKVPELIIEKRLNLDPRVCVVSEWVNFLLHTRDGFLLFFFSCI